MVLKKQIDTISVKKDTAIVIAIFCGIATLHEVIEISFKLNQLLSLDICILICSFFLFTPILLLFFNYKFPDRKWRFSRHLIILSFCISLIFIFTIFAKSIHTSDPSIPIIKVDENPRTTLLEEEIKELRKKLKEAN